MPYTEIRRGHRTYGTIPNDLVRLTNRTIAISPNIGERFQANRTQTETGREAVQLGIAIDEINQRIKLLPNAENRFSFGTASNTASNSTLYSQKPSNLKRSAMPVGDYLLVPDSDLEFELVR